MAAKIVAIAGSYRKGKVIDTAVAEVLRGAEAQGATGEKTYLIDKHVESCTNCRACTQDKGSGRRGTCVHNGAMEEILAAIDEADGVVLGAPTNFSNVNALTRRFMERRIVYAYWPWGARIPVLRVKRPDKVAVTVTASACPAFLAKVIMPGPRKALKLAAQTMGAKARTAFSYGGIAQGPAGTVREKDVHKARRAGVRLAGAIGQTP